MSIIGIMSEDDELHVGARVWVGGSRPATVAYTGQTRFAPGDWVGVILDQPNGQNSGIVSGVEYFQCTQRRGLFTKAQRLTSHPIDEIGHGLQPILAYTGQALRDCVAFIRDRELGSRCHLEGHRYHQLLKEKYAIEYSLKYINTAIREAVAEAGHNPAVAENLQIRATPKIFCDICEEFNLHIVENCPKQWSC